MSLKKKISECIQKNLLSKNLRKSTANILCLQNRRAKNKRLQEAVEQNAKIAQVSAFAAAAANNGASTFMPFRYASSQW